MKIHDRKQFWMGLLWLGVAALRLVTIWGHWGAEQLASLVLPLFFAGRCFFDALQQTEDPKERAKKNKLAAQKLFGRWYILVWNLGYGVVVAALLSMLLAPNWADVALLAIIAGFFYTGVIESVVRKEADKL